MSRRMNSGSKWKEVLGFDDGSSVSTSSSTRSPPASLYSHQSSHHSDLRRESSPPTYPRFPRDITFFRSKGDILLSPSSPAPSPNDIKPLPAPPHLFYITIQQDPLSTTQSRRPDIILHSGPTKSAPIISVARLYAVALATDMTLCPPAPKPISSSFSSIDLSCAKSSLSSHTEHEFERPQFRNETLIPSGGIFTAEKHSFSHTLTRSGVRERFEWRNSSRSFSRSFDGDKDTGGLKLIRVSTGDVIAVYAGLGQRPGGKTSRVLGMFRFLQGEGSAGLGEDLEVLAIVSLLSIVERGRRTIRAHREAFGIR